MTRLHSFFSRERKKIVGWFHWMPQAPGAQPANQEKKKLFIAERRVFAPRSQTQRNRSHRNPAIAKQAKSSAFAKRQLERNHADPQKHRSAPRRRLLSILSPSYYLRETTHLLSRKASSFVPLTSSSRN